MASKAGYWGNPTASEDWCEYNYVRSFYIAEYWNSITSLTHCILAAYGLALAFKQNWKRRFLFPLIAFFFVGVGSIAFHGTLTFSGQAVDELSMIWAAVTLLYSSVEDSPTRRFGIWLPASALVYCLAFTVTYMKLPQFFFYFVMTFILLVIMIFVASGQTYQRLKNKKAGYLFQTSVVLYVGSFLLLWLPDKLHCTPTIQALHLHAWFHVCTAFGAWCIILFIVHNHYAMARESIEANASSKLAGMAMIPIVDASPNSAKVIHDMIAKDAAKIAIEIHDAPIPELGYHGYQLMHVPYLQLRYKEKP